ncbi:MAG: protein translocase subunit SecF [Ignavibacteria bacterium]|nr:protein translocase subunit SecF [Ignavibacteria bacterium]
MRLFKQTHIDFMGKRRMWFAISLSVIILGMISLVFKGIGWGIDFLGGTEVVVQFSRTVEVSEIRTVMSNAGFSRAEIKEYGEASRILIRTPEQGEGTTVADKIISSLSTSFPQDIPQVLEEQKIGPKIGAELRRGAMYAIFASLVAILLYIGFRFKFIYGVGAVTALFHDVLVVLGLLSIIDGLTPFTNFEIDQNMIAALLTLVGLSVNDTVVIFDRIRENQKIHRTMNLFDVMNKSLNETLSRTIITSGTIFLVTTILFFFGGEVNRGLGFALTIGVITGTYSSIYIASSVVLEYVNYKVSKTSEATMLKVKKAGELVK